MTDDVAVAVYRVAAPGEEPDALFHRGRGGKRAGVLVGPRPDGPRAAEEFYGAATVAQWGGVTRSAVAKWFERYTDMPAEDARLVVDEKGRYERYYREDRKDELTAWMRSRAAHGAPGEPKQPRKYSPRDPESEERRRAAWLDSSAPDERGRIHVTDVAGLLPLRATVPYGPRKTVRAALDAAPGRIVLSAADDPAAMWLWAADQEAADAAAQAMPGLLFEPHS